jgi:hypothetical protein
MTITTKNMRTWKVHDHGPSCLWFGPPLLQWKNGGQSLCHTLRDAQCHGSKVASIVKPLGCHIK